MRSSRPRSIYRYNSCFSNTCSNFATECCSADLMAVPCRQKSTRLIYRTVCAIYRAVALVNRILCKSVRPTYLKQYVSDRLKKQQNNIPNSVHLLLLQRFSSTSYKSSHLAEIESQGILPLRIISGMKVPTTNVSSIR